MVAFSKLVKTVSRTAIVLTIGVGILTHYQADLVEITLGPRVVTIATHLVDGVLLCSRDAVLYLSDAATALSQLSVMVVGAWSRSNPLDNFRENIIAIRDIGRLLLNGVRYTSVIYEAHIQKKIYDVLGPERAKAVEYVATWVFGLLAVETLTLVLFGLLCVCKFIRFVVRKIVWVYIWLSILVRGFFHNGFRAFGFLWGN